jgi:hypothetical protein
MRVGQIENADQVLSDFARRERRRLIDNATLNAPPGVEPGFTAQETGAGDGPKGRICRGLLAILRFGTSMVSAGLGTIRWDLGTGIEPVPIPRTVAVGE